MTVQRAFFDRAVGIDLGTTNSEIAWLPPSESNVLIYADRFGRRTLPSAVGWAETENAFVVGYPARSMRESGSPAIESIKRKMGQDTTVAVGPHRLRPEEVSAKILATLRDRVKEMLETTQPLKGAADVELRVTRAVITVPAYFDAPQVEATRKAGELAGLDVIGILQEPTAAAIYHTWKRRLGDGNFLVYDLGGGTFDVSVLRCIGGEYQVLAIDGDNYLGGDDFDRRFADQLRKELAAKGYSLELDVRGNDADRRTFARLVHLAQEIKESLSTSEVVSVKKENVAKDKAGEAISYEGEVGRNDYETIIGDLFETTMRCCERALARSAEVASVGLNDIDHVILVGGSTRLPLVVRRITETFCKKDSEPLRDDVDTCVALGAAIHAAHVGGSILGTQGARIRITSPLVSQKPALRLNLTVEESPKDAARVTIWEGERALADAGIKEASKLDVALGNAETTAATLALQSTLGVPIVELPLPLYRGDIRPRPTALSRASVVAKDIALEVVRGGKRERKVLIARGTGLPTQVSHLFFTADQSGAVVLRILQNRLPVKTLLIEVPRDLAVGSPVEVVLRCDESMRLEAQATVGSTQIQAHIEPPAVSATAAVDVESLLEEVDRARRSLWGGLGSEFTREADQLVYGIREVLHTDPDKLEALCQRLRHVIDEFHGGESGELVPPVQRMDDAFDSLRRIVYRSSGLLVGMERAEWERRIDALYDKATAAREANDAPKWRRVFNEVQALAETAYQEEFAQLRLDDPAYIERRAGSLSWRLSRVEESLAEFVPSAAEEVRAMQTAEQARIQGWLADTVAKPLRALKEEKKEPADMRRALERIDAELDRIEVAVERVPQIGLVTDRGAG